MLPANTESYNVIDASKIIPELKRIKKNEHLTLQAIYDMVNVDGVQIVSKSSINRIFEDGSEEKEFKDYVIRPVAAALTGMNKSDDFDPSSAKTYFDQRNILQEAIKIRAEQEKELLDLVEKQAARHKEEINGYNIQSDRQIKALEHTISILEKDNEFYRGLMESLHEFIKKDRESKSKLFDEVTRLHEEIDKLKSYHKIKID